MKKEKQEKLLLKKKWQDICIDLIYLILNLL